MPVNEVIGGGASQRASWSEPLGAGRVGDREFIVRAGTGGHVRTIVWKSEVLDKTCQAIDCSVDSTDGRAQRRLRQAVADANCSCRGVLNHLIQAIPDGHSVFNLSDKVERLLDNVAGLQWAGGRSGGVLREIIRVHLKEVSIEGLVAMRISLNDIVYRDSHWVPPKTRTSLNILSTLLNERYAWLATHKPLCELANLCQSLRQGDLLDCEAVPRQIRLLQAGMNMLRDASRTVDGTLRDTEWREDEQAQMEGRAEFLAPAVRDLHDTLLATLEDLLTNDREPAPVAQNLLQDARSGPEFKAMSEVFEALGGAVRAEKAIRLDRAFQQASEKFEAVLNRAFLGYRAVTDSRRMCSFVKGKDVPVDPDDRAYLLLAHALAQTLPKYLKQDSPCQPPRGPAFVENADIPQVAAQFCYVDEWAEPNLHTALEEASQNLSGIIARIGMVHGYDATSEAGLHNVLILGALANTSLWYRLVAQESIGQGDTISLDTVSNYS
jgi:hypothetical protein